MCGICGIFNFDGAPVDKERIVAMANLIRHRGPDDEGYHIDGQIGLGFRRLSIVDLEGGKQPMPNEDGSIQVVFNGEIYNFQDIKRELKSLGHRFLTHADSEVLPHAYEEWGTDFVKRLNGMFAFALWDARRRRLMLARDRLGIKPLAFWRNGSTLAFASEIKCFLTLPEFKTEIDDRAVFDYFSYLYIPDPQSIYRDVTKLSPGDYLIAEDGNIRIQEYWRPRLQRSEPRDIEQWSEELREHMKRSVEMRMMADVPVGVFLSGGIDSSAVTAAMSKVGVSNIRSFTIGFDVPEYDETGPAAMVSELFNTEHKALSVTSEITDLLPLLLWHMDEPIADATIIPTYLLSRMTREHVTVALSGEGGDETFAGYTHYQGMALNRKLNMLPRWMRRSAAWTAGHLPRFGSTTLGFRLHRVQRVLESSLFPPFEDYVRKVAIFNPEQQSCLFTEDFLKRTADFRHFEAARAAAAQARDFDPIAQAGFADLNVFLPGALLMKVDKMSMAASLEVRVPFLDHELVEHALTIPTELKLKGMRTKHILKEALKPWLPPEIINRKKRGFNPPLEYWLKSNLMDFAAKHKMLETLEKTGYVNTDYVRKLAEDHTSGRRNYKTQLWALLVFAIWFNRVRGKWKEPE